MEDQETRNQARWKHEVKYLTKKDPLQSQRPLKSKYILNPEGRIFDN